MEYQDVLSLCMQVNRCLAQKSIWLYPRRFKNTNTFVLLPDDGRNFRESGLPSPCVGLARIQDWDEHNVLKFISYKMHLDTESFCATYRGSNHTSSVVCRLYLAWKCPPDNAPREIATTIPFCNIPRTVLNNDGTMLKGMEGVYNRIQEQRKSDMHWQYEYANGRESRD